MKAHISRSTAPALGLVWGIAPASPDWQALERAAAPLGLTLRPVTPAQLSLTLAQLCGATVPAAPALPAAPAADTPALVLSGLANAKLDLLLAALRRGGPAIPLKAVATPTNLGWTFRDLLAELAREHAALGR